MKNLSKCQETMIIQQEKIKSIINSFVQIYQGKQIRESLYKLISQKIRKDDDGAATFFVAENQQKTTLLLTLRARNFSLESLIVTEQYKNETWKNICDFCDQMCLCLYGIIK